MLVLIGLNLNDSWGWKKKRRLSVEYCRKILNSNGGKYSEQEAKRVRDILYLLGAIDYEIFKQILKDNEKGNSVRKSVNG
ncbi:MAG: hypothetical protein NVV82_07185 [Sporocytophaga sp.]|nr:hypothetical protein [Sporocytophaga sp.]